MIIANFEGNESVKYVSGLYQYDKEQVLQITGLNLPRVVEIDFSLEETGVTSKSCPAITKDGITEVMIPNEMLVNQDTDMNYNIYAFVYVTDASTSETVKRIVMQVRARTKPEQFEALGNRELFEKAINEVNNSADRAETAANTSDQNAKKTAEDRKTIEEMVETVSGIEQQVQDVKKYAGQAETAASNAALSEQEAKEAKTAALQAKADAETAKGSAETAAGQTAEDKTAVERAKEEVLQAKQQVSTDREAVEAVERKVAQMGNTIPQAVLEGVQAVGNAGAAEKQGIVQAGTEQKYAVESVGTKAVGDIALAKKAATDAVETAKTGAVGAIGTAGTEQTQNVTAEGEKQVKAVADKGAEVLQSIPENFVMQMESKLDKQQGAENAGKAMVINPEGVIVPGEVTGGDGIPIINTASGESPLVISDSAERVNKGLSILGNTVQNQDPPPSPDNQQEIKNVGKWNPETQKYEVDIRITNAKESWDKEQTLALTSDRPITKWDKLVEQDGQIGWLYQSCKKEFDGTEVFDERFFPSVLYVLNKKEYIKNAVLCNYADSNGITRGNTVGSTLSFRKIADYWKCENAQQFKVFLKAKKDVGVPLCVLWETVETEFVPLSQSEQNAIRALKTYYPTTVITVDGGEVIPTVELTYTADTKNFILNREKAMQAQMLNIQSALISQKISGGGIKVTDSSRLPVEEFSMSGKTEQIQSTGKNLIFVPDIEAGSSQQSIPCLLEKDVYISCHEKTAKVSTDIWRIRIMFKDKSSKYLNDSQMEGGNKFVCGTENPIIGIVVRGNNIESGAYRKIQVEYGSAKTSYEPFTGGKPTPSPDYPQPIEVTPQGIITVDFTDGTNNQTVELNCPREFTKWDRLQKIDGVWKWVFRTCRYIITGDEEFVAAGEEYTTGSSTNFYTNVVQNTERQANGFMERLRSVDAIWSKVNETGFRINSTQLHMRLPNTLLGVSDTATKEEKKTAYVNYLKAEYKKGTPYSLMYEQVVPELIPLSQSEQDKLNALTMYAPNTEISNTGGCNMELTYTVDTKSYVDAKIAEVSTAVVQKGIENV